MLALCQGRTEEVDPMTRLLNVFIMPAGAICGGFAVGAVKWVIDKILFYYLPNWGVYAIGIAVMLGGPDLLPPLTLLNGCDKLIDRFKWTVLLNAFYYYYDGNSAYNFIMVISGLWHIDRGDYEYKRFGRVCRREFDTAFNEENHTDTIAYFSLCIFRVTAGVGMLWAGCGVYTLAVFVKALFAYIGIQLLIFFGLGGINEIRGQNFN
jgi:hypothetical protein